MKEWKVILATLVIFAAGVLTGGLLVNHSTKPRVKPPSSPNKPVNVRGPAYESRFLYIRMIERQLDLSAEQRDKIDLLIDASQLRTKGLLDAVQPKVNDELKRVKEQIREQLNPEQRKKFDELNKRPAKKETKKEQRKEAQRTNSAPATNAPVTP